MPPHDIRWIQRYNNFLKAFSQLHEAVNLAQQRPLSRLEQQGMIQAFEFTHELAWNTLKDFFENRGVQNLYGSRDATRLAFKEGLIQNGEAWMEMIQSRNLTAHTYDEAAAAQIVGAIRNVYVAEFEAFRNKMDELKAEEAG